MDEMPSSEFRKTYAKLTEPTIVTVNGHAIGVWNPSSAKGIAAVRDWPTALSSEHAIEFPDIDLAVIGPGRPFNTRPFTPVPKKGK